MITGTSGNDTLILGYGEAQDVDGLGGTDTLILDLSTYSANGLYFTWGADPSVGLTLLHPGGSTGAVSSLIRNIEFLQMGDITFSLLSGTAAGETLLASGSNSAQIYAGDGNDFVTGGSGTDDIIAGGFGSDFMTGNGGQDEFLVADSLAGDLDGDTISDFGIGDIISFDNQFLDISQFTFTQNAGFLTVDLDVDFDTITDASFTLTGDFTAVIPDFRTENFFNGVTNGTRLTLAPEFEGTSGNDIISGSIRGDALEGGDGDDIISGGVGADRLTGGAGVDTLTGGAGRDSFAFFPFSDAGTTPDIITDFEAGDFITFADPVFGNRDPEIPSIFIGTGSFTGLAGEIRYVKSGGTTEIIMDSDGDMSGDHYILLTNGEFDLRATIPGSPSLEIDVPFGFATDFDDGISGSSGNDVINALAGNDSVTAGAGDDTVFAGDGDDVVSGGLGNDFADGGAGMDSYQRFYNSQIHALVTDSSMTEVLSGESDLLNNFERISLTQRLAPASNDILDASTSTLFVDLFGGGGDDILLGGSGNNSIEGDNGTDLMTGGLGVDRFTFDYLKEIQNDVITDLEIGDTVELTFIEFVELVPIQFIGTAAFSGLAGEYRYGFSGGTTVIELDVDGNMSADKFITMSNGEFDLFEISPGLERLSILSGGTASVGDDYLTGTEVSDTISGGDGNDRINGFYGDDTLSGGNGSDGLFGGAGADVLNGGVGQDRIYGGDGDDIINDTQFLAPSDNDVNDGGAGIDTYVQDIGSIGASYDLAAGRSYAGSGLSPRDYFVSIENLTVGGDSAVYGDDGANELRVNGTLNNIMDGRGGDDRLFAGGGNDTVSGGDGNDRLFGEDGNDALTGGLGNDRLYGATGADSLDGGFGFDMASYESSSAGVTVNLAAGSGVGGDAQGDTLVSIERVVGSGFQDFLTGDNFSNRLEGGDGDDTLFGNGGFDKLLGGAGADTMDGGADFDTVTYENSTAAVNINLSTNINTGGDAAGDVIFNVERIFGSAFDDVLTGDGATNRLEGGDGNDTLNGGGGNDILYGLDGADSFDGGAGRDIVYYDRADGGVNVDLAAGGLWNEADGDSYVSVEIVKGSHFDDVLTGDGAFNNLFGNDGNDILNGAAGDDTIQGGDGDDIFLIRAGDDKERIKDWDNGADRFDVSDFGISQSDAAAMAFAFGSGWAINFGGGDVLIVENANLADVDVSDFIV